MLSVKGIYENGKVHLIEPLPFRKKARVIVTLLEDMDDLDTNDHEQNLNAFDDLVGVINVRENGSEEHDNYLMSENR